MGRVRYKHTRVFREDTAEIQTTAHVLVVPQIPLARYPINSYCVPVCRHTGRIDKSSCDRRQCKPE